MIKKLIAFTFISLVLASCTKTSIKAYKKIDSDPDIPLHNLSILQTYPSHETRNEAYIRAYRSLDRDNGTTSFKIVDTQELQLLPGNYEIMLACKTSKKTLRPTIKWEVQPNNIYIFDCDVDIEEKWERYKGVYQKVIQYTVGVRDNVQVKATRPDLLMENIKY